MTAESIYQTNYQPGVTPFSNGSEAIDWMENNCNSCQRSWCCRHQQAEPPSWDVTEKLAKEGKECYGAFALGFGFVSGSIPPEVATWIGATIRGNFCHMPDQCLHFTSSVEPPTPPDPNQLSLF